MNKEAMEQFAKFLGEQTGDVEMENFIKSRIKLYDLKKDEEANRRFKEMLFEWIEKEVEK